MVKSICLCAVPRKLPSSQRRLSFNSSSGPCTTEASGQRLIVYKLQLWWCRSSALKIDDTLLSVFSCDRSDVQRDGLGNLESWPCMRCMIWVILVVCLQKQLGLTVARNWAAPARAISTATPFQAFHHSANQVSSTLHLQLSWKGRLTWSVFYSLLPLRCWQLSIPQKLGKIDEGRHQTESSNYRNSNIN